MIVVDTSVWVDLFRGVRGPHTVWLLDHLESEHLGLTDLTFCEVLQGMRMDDPISDTQSSLVAVGVHATGGAELAEEAARNYRFLRQRGITVRTTIDCLIATYCIRGGHSLLHNDRDFDPFEKHLGLRVVHP